MPTARELLEQADALMRRNRERAGDDIPVLTDAVPSPPDARSTVAPPPRPVEAPSVPSDVGDDLPLLTDEVEEIDAVAIDAAVDEGEPSVWLDFDSADPSVIGDAPDSIAIVPPVDLRRTETAPDVEEFDELDEELAAAIAAAPPEQETLQPSPPLADPARESPEPHPQTPPSQPALIAGGAAALLHGEAPAPVVAAAGVPMHEPPEHARRGTEPYAMPEAAGDANLESMPPSPQPPAAGAASDAAQSEVMPLPAAGATSEAARSEVMSPPVTPPAAVDVPDAANWDAMAEEIRMQVLQRIDMFTDTGLRTQLGERLQPIVDRASADLVATINQHVGELLRAYVAEAIEREIDSWRRNH